MGKELSPQENDFTNNLSTIILCAGEGTRLKEITKTIPKPLIKIESFNNISILNKTIIDLLKLGIKQIAIVVGHLGYKISNFISIIKKKKKSLQDKILIIDTEDQYRIGPLYSFLSITKNRAFFNNINYFILIPGDTIFDFNILKEIMHILSKNVNKIQDHAFIFYRHIGLKKLKEIHEKTKVVSIAEIERLRINNLLKNISQVDLQILSSTIKVNQIIPIFMLSKKIITEILDLKTEIPGKTVWEALNFVAAKGKKIFAFEIKNTYNFYDIDSINDLNRFNKKKRKGQ